MGIDALKSLKPNPPPAATPTPAPAAVVPAAAPVVTTPPATQYSPTEGGDRLRMAAQLGQDAGAQPLDESTPTVSARELELQTRVRPEAGTVREPGKPTETKPSADPANQDVTGEMSAEQQREYDQLPAENRTEFNQQYRAAEPETRAAMDHALEEGLAGEYLAAPREQQEKYVALHTEAATRTGGKAVDQVDGLLADGELGAYLAVEGRAGTDEAQQLQTLLFDGTLRQARRGDPSMLDYLGDFAADPSAVTPEPGLVPRDDLVNQIINDVYSNRGVQPPGDRNCGPVQAMASFAHSDPAAFARTQTELAETGHTEIRTPSGQTETLTYRGPPRGQENGLSLTQQIFLQAFAAPVDRTSQRGGGFLGQLLDAFDGMTAAEVAQLQERTSGAGSAESVTDYEVVTVPTSEELEETTPEEAERLREIAEKTIDEQVRAGEPPTVWMEGEDGTGGHWVRVLNVVELGPIKLYVLDDGSGNPRMMGANAFMEGVGAVVYNADHSTPPPGSYNEAWDDPGTGSKNLAGDPGDGG
ncbi:MAG: hypothetical protein M3Y59_15380 [Myxococcota bacterium]|nr:hypothetical protein [Myxococcota bacterium]